MCVLCPRQTAPAVARARGLKPASRAPGRDAGWSLVQDGTRQLHILTLSTHEPGVRRTTQTGAAARLGSSQKS